MIRAARNYINTNALADAWSAFCYLAIAAFWFVVVIAGSLTAIGTFQWG